MKNGNNIQSAFALDGPLNEGDIYAILYHIHKNNISGVLVVESDGCQKKMVIRDRKIVFASSNRKTDFFADYLFRHNLIRREIYTSATGYMHEHQVRFGRALMELGYFSYDQIWTWVPKHLESIVYSFFKIKSGSYRVMVEEEADIDIENIVLDLDILLVIVEGMRHFKNKDFLALKFSAIENLYIHHNNADSILKLKLKPYEMHIFQLVRKESGLEKIVKRSELLEFDTLRILYLLLVLEIISTKETVQIMKPETLPESEALEELELMAAAVTANGNNHRSEEPEDIPIQPSRLSVFNSFEEALKYYNLKYEIIGKVMIKEIGPISVSLLLKAIEDVMENLPPYFRKLQLNQDGTVFEDPLIKSLWYHDFDQNIGEFLTGLEEILYTEIYTVKKHLGIEYEQQVLKWIRGIGN